MKIVLSSAILVGVWAPAFSFSYLDSLNKSNPVSYSAGGSPSNGASYLDALTSRGNAPSGTGMTSYLDSVSSLPYTASAPAAPAPVVASAPVESFSAPVASGVSYLDSLSRGSNSINGPGVTTYLDTVPRNAPVMGGAGIGTYKDALPVTNVVYGTGTGLNSYTDNLSGGSKPSGGYSPFGGSKRPSFSGSAGGQTIGFTLEASDLSELVRSMSGGGTIRLSGSIDSVSFN